MSHSANTVQPSDLEVRARHTRSAKIPWVPSILQGKASKPLRFFRNDRGFVELLRMEPGTEMPHHRHRGETHVFQLTGARRLDTGDIVRAGGYVYEPPGHIDRFEILAGEPMTALVIVSGVVDDVSPAGESVGTASAATRRAEYRAYCRKHGLAIEDLEDDGTAVTTHPNRTSGDSRLGSHHVDTESQPWIASGVPGKSSKPLCFLPDGAGFVELVRMEPGGVMPLHRHTGETHVYQLAGMRALGSGEVVAPGDYVYEAPGNRDHWKIVGEECAVALALVRGKVEFLGPDGSVCARATAGSQAEAYCRYCREHGLKPLELGDACGSG